ncbi:putative cohesin complex subunit [Aaosphaeria arxii CBS 175.79]|uniref:Structural maintenance of chromosomes protein n=1 Tax=Aaosphaeria arxii CBS 175.79 TaxID=1450172 RepID=A0A6A5Y940_9PLEO|nr:putative cohesin complex subunit [Aaosphaeria arxii CBS 175.79]KAF2022105.1 putative cohesin complex subunit [Aaosphaeria arxii CBS 175.79]
MGKLVQLEVNNFKSYRGHHVLLFGDSYFTSIIGPNGSGKSNSMDAISFVLGIKSSHLRSSTLKDLIYRGRIIRTTKINEDGTATEANGDDQNGAIQDNGDSQPASQRGDPQTAWVMAVFEDDAGQVHKWKRSITSSYTSEYRIDGRTVSQQQYNSALEEQSILIKARNFLVFQGDVENVASQNPKDLTRLVEQISGSLEYKAQYERLKAEAENATVNQTDHLQTRRQINAEMKQWQEHKSAADDLEKKEAAKAEAIVTHVLWKLFHFQQTIAESSEEIAKHKEELKQHKRGVEKYEKSLEQAQQAQAKASREANKTVKAIRGKEKEIEDAENNLVPIDEKIKISTADVHKYEERIAAISKERETQVQQIAKFEKDLATVQKAQDKWEKEAAAAAKQQGKELSQADFEEYTRLRGDVTKQTHANQNQINRLEQEIRTEQDSVRNLKQKVDDSQSRVSRFETDIKELQEQQRQAQARLKDLEKERASKQHALDKHRATRQSTEKMRTELDQNLREALFRLREADSGRRQSERERKARESVNKMRQLFGTGVYGRYSDLVKPKQKKYERAVETLLGWHMDAIIVDTDRTAKQCIRYLKEQKVGVFTFIPLDTITVMAVNQNLKGMHKGMRLGIDCIDYDGHLERAMASACGNSMICDDINVAKYLCYEKRVDAKAVTLDGTVIAKGGTITGGRLGSDKSGQRFNEAHIERLQREIDKIKSQMDALPRYDRRDPEHETLENEVADLTDQISRTTEEIKALARNLDSKKKELQHHKQQLKEWQPKYNDEERQLQALQQEFKGYQTAVDQVVDQVFAAFCQRLGYANIRDYEQQQGKAQQEALEKKSEFARQRDKIERILGYHKEQLSSLDERTQNMRDRVERSQKNVDEFEAEKETLQGEIDVLQAELERLNETYEELNEKLAERTKVVKEARAELEERNKAVKGVIKAVEEEEAKIKRTADSRYVLLKDCRQKFLKIPLAEGSASLDAIPLQGVGGPDPDAMDVDEEDIDATQIQQPEIDDFGVEVDFDELDDELKEDDSPECGTRLEEKISALDAEIAAADRNVDKRAGDKLHEVENRLKDTTKVFETARKEAVRARKEFEEVKQKRLDAFQKAFNHISDNIGGTYKDLTKSREFPLGGQAYLDMEDSTEPYNAGLKYHAMPPLKRFRDMEHLSGGEKTIAALALLFAIHSYQPSPFFVLDEVDAALDNVNVGRVAKYVREHASPGMQFIVISLKAGLFQESESLVGVMRDQAKMSSRVVSLDLRKYQPS